MTIEIKNKQEEIKIKQVKWYPTALKEGDNSNLQRCTRVYLSELKEFFDVFFKCL